MIPPKVCGRFWKWLRFGVHTYSQQFIALLGLNLLQGLYTRLILLIFYLYLLHLLDQGQLILKLVLVCVKNNHVGPIHIKNTDLLPLQFFGRLCRGIWLYDWTSFRHLIGWIQVNNPEFHVLIVDFISFSSEITSSSSLTWDT